MKRGGFLQRHTPIQRHSSLSRNSSMTRAKRTMRYRHPSETNYIKERIQEELREIVIFRDGGCILRHTPQAGPCNGFKKDGTLVLQADHLETRANAASYADPRLVVCLCPGHHGGFKKWNKEKYDAIVRTLISPERVALWDAVHAARYQAKRNTTYDWRMELIALVQERVALQRGTLNRINY